MRRFENIKMAIAWKMPRWLVYFCAIRLMAEATIEYPDKTPDEISLWDYLGTWEAR